MGAMSLSRGRMLTLALLVCVVASAGVVMGPGSTAAWAQEPTSAVTATATPVAVVDFVNKSGFGGDGLGRSAADALVLGMDESKRFDPLKRAEVDQAMSRLGFTIPMDQAAQSRLGRQLEVPDVASGTINEVHFEQTDQGRVGVVDITVMLLNVESEEFNNGARIVKGSTPKPGYTADDASLVDEALSLATYQAVRTMLAYKLPSITVLSAAPGSAYLSGGSQAGLFEGMELVIMRFGDRAGRVRVTNVEPTAATAAIVANYRGVAAGDTAVPVFQAPSTTMAAAVHRAKSRSKLTSAVLGIAAAAGIFFTLSTRGPNETPVPNVIASSFSEPSGVGRLPGVLITWSPFHHEEQNVVAYVMVRNGIEMLVQMAQVGSGTFVVDTEIPGVSDLAITTPIEVDATTGQLIPPVDSNVPNVISLLTTQTPPEAGVQYVYRITPIVAVLRFSPATTASASTAAAATRQTTAPAREWVLERGSMAGSSAATALDPPELTAPAPGAEVIDLAEVIFTWSAVDTADEYVLQISRDSLFMPVNTKTFTINGAFPKGTSLTQTVNVAAIFPPPSGGGVLTLHWRVGARNTQDPSPPRTDPALFQTFPQHQGYVWSNPGNSTFFFTGTTTAATSGRAPRRIRLLAPKVQ